MRNSKKVKSEFYDNLTTKELEVVAKQGDVEAQFMLGYRYRYGEKAKKNYSKAIEWYKKAAVQGNKKAKLALSKALQEKGALFR